MLDSDAALEELVKAYYDFIHLWPCNVSRLS